MLRTLTLVGVALLAGCAGPAGLGTEADLTVAKHAEITIRNEDAEAYAVHVETSVNGAPVDQGNVTSGAGEATQTSIGLPETGNVRIRLTVTDTGRSGETTLASGSCATIRVDAVIRDGAPHLPTVECR